MLLDGKVAVVFGAGGAVGGAVARHFAEEGAAVFLSGRTSASVEDVQRDIAAKGGTAQVAQVDASNESDVEGYLADVAARAGAPDVVLNAIGIDAVQGVPLVELSLADFMFPIATWTSSQFLTSRVAARHMAQRGSGTILTLSASPATLAIAGTGGFGVACASVEALSRTLAAELGPAGIRVACLRPHRIGETLSAPDYPMPEPEFREFLEGMTLLKRLPTLNDVARTAAFIASDGASAMSGSVVNLTCGMSVN
ncbi:SDR family NAD(P)-dependent oxidoreductase [Micromonospora halophytica]|uniref:NADP-dependent 3-hydroxy acid dehydrogenase YdfG n=1 Tax=Micromonospora halophytica TaxID=47864 RepID=A0A1C5IM64_9ACTN|nr:SDR family oxidoreductase [Micromonospora halophytica]SCG59099.1 NADP-dependent 3-hydroxy acid dehydrogenase YdfG [Micromonospora halophytica]